MNANVWNTPTVEDAEIAVANGLRLLARMQAAIDARDAERLPVPADTLADYEECAMRLSAFVDAWGFDINDVMMEPSRDAMH